jgi:para-nitrobenzyl esterase
MDISDRRTDKRGRLGFAGKLFFGLAAICAATVGSVVIATAAPAIVTDRGPLKGIVTPKVKEYLGIPYATPPVGSLRWLPPQPPARFKGLFQATQFGNACPQSDGAGGVFGDENCLFLNVYVPNVPQDQQPAHGFSVMVWIHGGGLVAGAGSFYDPTSLVEKGRVIVVTINYRLGYLGFFAHPALDAEGHLAGNYGLMDQQCALKWVRRNIGAFGGDRNRVTIFGQSAGGLSVYSNLASPTGAGLFQRAIAESGAYVSFAGHTPFQNYLVGVVSLAVAESSGSLGFGFVPSGLDAATSVGCGSQTADCLRAVAASALVAVEPLGVFPFVDGTVLTQPPGLALASGAFNHVPVITGSNHDEYRYFVALQYDLGVGQLTDAGYPAAVAAFLLEPAPPPISPFTAFILGIYPLTNFPPPAGVVSAPLALGALGTDVVFACPARNAAQAVSAYVPTYAYEFNDENAPSILPPLSFPLGAYHFSEVPYLFDFGVSSLFTSDQQHLSDLMIGYWTQFAKTGNPNSDDVPTWSLYNATTDKFQSLVPRTPVVESTFDADHKCSGLWNTL